MKTTRKLIPAIAMLLVAVVMMSTASYAWFSMSKEVSATGMSLTANAPSNLLISNKANPTTWASTVTISENYTGKLDPASSGDGVKFNAITSGNYIGASGIGGVAVHNSTKFLASSDQGGSKVIKMAEGNANAIGNWVDYQLNFKITGTSDVNIYLKEIKVTDVYAAVTGLTAGTSIVTGLYTEAAGVYTEVTVAGQTAVGGTTYYKLHKIVNATRLAIFEETVLGSGTFNKLVSIYAVDTASVLPINGTFTTDGEVYDNTTDVAATDPKLAVASYDTKTITVPANEVTKTILVRVWIEGENTITVNEHAAEKLNIGLVFAIKE